LSKLLAQAATATGGAVPTAQAQEPADALLRRVLIMLVAGLVFSPLAAPALHICRVPMER